MIFSTVKSLVETIGRQRSRTFTELDQLTCIWTGPTAAADGAPGIGATHPQYGNMEVRAQRKISEAGGITRIQLEYVGLFDGGSIGAVGRGFSSQVGELEWTLPAWTTTGSNSFGQVDPNTGFTILGGSKGQTLVGYKVYTQTYITSYISRNSTFKYCAKNPTHPRFGGGLIDSEWTRLGAQSNATYSWGTVNGPPASSLPTGMYGYSTEFFCSSFQTEPISSSWSRCTEVWSARLIAGH